MNDRTPLVLEDAVVLPMVERGVRAEALAVRDGRILAVGERGHVRAAAGPAARVVSARGRAIVPGFIDAHHHFLQAVVYGGAVPLEGARSHDEIVALLREAARTTPPGEWVIGHGYNPALLQPRSHPRLWLLDAACPEHPCLVVEYSFHEGAANTLGLSAAGFSAATPDPPGGNLGRTRRGRLNGHLSERALFTLEAVARESVTAREAEQILQRLPAYQARLFAYGITHVCEPGVPPQSERLLRRALAEGLLQIPVTMMPIGSGGFAEPPGDRLDGPSTGEGSERLRVGPVKVVLDGGTRCAMCLSLAQGVEVTLTTAGRALAQRSLAPVRASLDLLPRLGRDLKLRSGTRFYTSAQSTAVVRAACERGFGVALHAIGNEAVGQALDAIAASRAQHRDVPPPRIEHASTLTVHDARRAADLGVAVALQPDFLRLPAFELLPPPGGLRYLAARTLIDAGVLVAGSSDAPVTGFDPLDGMRSALLRRTRSGRSFQADEAITIWEALEAYTRNAAQACGALAACGTLEPGKRADFVVLSADPTASTRSDALDGLRVEETYLGGERVHAAEAEHAQR